MSPPNIFRTSSVKLTPLPDLPDGKLTEKTHQKCFFCEKTCEMSPLADYSEKLCPPDRFWCPFCVRHGYHTKLARHVLTISFRSVIGYLHHSSVTSRKIYRAEIEDCIEAHMKAGLANPVFNYDPETFLWFIDFSRVGPGTDRRQLPVAAVRRTVVDILTCFNLWHTVPGFNPPAFYKKYEKAINSFYERRYRPPGKRMLIPTLLGCCSENKTSRFRDFISEK